ncbi:MAG: hypothetical protein BM564_04755 [Bacteroidetes bacterium MedPE-SWsnd-G2]|nr:MAG: hypothetical protein BM564_04755 [Bacteroidetes bacterium MedPE-SWsnd-G2]
MSYLKQRIKLFDYHITIALQNNLVIENKNKSLFPKTFRFIKPNQIHLNKLTVFTETYFNGVGIEENLTFDLTDDAQRTLLLDYIKSTVKTINKTVLKIESLPV